jgi:hypothetical protein
MAVYLGKEKYPSFSQNCYQRCKEMSVIYYREPGGNFLGLELWCLNATFNNISVISWQSVLQVEESSVRRETIDLPQVTDKH